MPRASVIIRTKDRPFMLARALDDVLAQDFSDWEVIIVNDGGNTDTVEQLIAERSDRLGQRCIVTHLAQSVGRPGAANRGFDHATGAFVVVHDDDDLWDPRFLARTVTHLETHPETVAIVVPTEIVIEQPEGDGFVVTSRCPSGPPRDYVSLFDLILINRVVPISMLFRRALLDELGGWDESLLCVEDWEFNLRLASAGQIDYLQGDYLAFWMHRPALGDGPTANSMFTSQAEHYEFDRLVRTRALAQDDRHHAISQQLYVSKFVDERLAEAEARIMNQTAARLEDLRRELRADIEYYSFGATVRRRFTRRSRRR